jgi:adenylate cyclase
MRHYLSLRHVFLCVIASFFCHTLLAQETMDSLKQALNQAENDSDKANTLLAIYKQTRFNNPKDALQSALESKIFADRSGNRRLVGNSLHAIGTTYTLLGDYDKGTDYLQQALVLRREIKDEVGISATLNNLANIYIEKAEYNLALQFLQEAALIDERASDRQGLAYEFDNIGNIYDYQDRFDSALFFRYKALSVREKGGSLSEIALSSVNIGNTYFKMSKYDSALSYANNAIRYAEQANDQRILARALGQIGTIYKEMGNQTQALSFYQKNLTLALSIHDKQGEANALSNIAIVCDNLGKPTESIEYSKKALAIYETMEDKQSISAVYINLSNAYQTLNNLDEAQLWLKKALDIKKEIADVRGEAIALENLGLVSARQKKFTEAIRYTEESLALAKKIGTLDVVQSGYEQLAGIYKQSGQYGNAFNAFEMSASLRDSIFRTETSKQLTEMSTKYESEKKDKAIQILTRDQELASLLRNALIGGFILVSLLGLVAYNRFLLKKKSGILLEEKNVIIEMERDKSEQLLLNVLPPSIAGRLKADSVTIADQFSEATILFADIVGFTKLSAQIGADKLVGMLNDIFTLFDAITGKYNLEKIKTIGDCYMVVGGLPIQDSQHCQSIAAMALEMLVALSEYCKKTNIELTIRIGINTGSVVAGVIGRKKFIYDLWGDAVNTASRMESHGEPSKIHVTEVVYERLKDTFTFEDRGEIEVKGKGLMKTYFLTGKV